MTTEQRRIQTYAMQWVIHVRTIPPQELLHDPSIQDNYGMTCAMYWIKYVRSVPPQVIRHDPSIQDNNGMTCAMHWIATIKTHPPSILLHDPSIQDNNGMTCAMYYVSCMRRYPPSEFEHDPDIINKDGLTLSGMCKEYDVKRTLYSYSSIKNAPPPPPPSSYTEEEQYDRIMRRLDILERNRAKNAFKRLFFLYVITLITLFIILRVYYPNGNVMNYIKESLKRYVPSKYRDFI